VPRVSVLLTCYNHLAYLPTALESVRNQTFRDFEVIAIDDGSTDGSREWLREQEGIQVVFNPANLGTYGTLNRALALASGEFIAVLNDDDVWAPKKLARQVALLDESPEVALVHTGGRFIDGSGAVRDGNPLGFAFPRFQSGDILLGLVYENKIIASAALTRTSVLRELGGFNETYFGSGDWEMWFRVAERHHVGFVDEQLTDYRVHGANASHKLERIWRDDEKLRTWMVGQIDAMDSGRFPLSDVRRARAFNYAALGTVQVLNGQPGNGRRSYAKSISIEPTRWKSYARWLLACAGTKTFRKFL
jgi:glycosyltransferase involved in cell wall biosynthesis